MAEIAPIPARFGRIRRWWYAHYPLLVSDLCPDSDWRHYFVADDGWGWGEAHCCFCGRKGYIDYGR